MSELVLSADQIKALLEEVARELPSRPQRHTIVVVGGSLLAWHGMRSATKDVDSIKRLEAELVDVVADVASRHGLAPRWLNDSSAAFVPVTFDESQCQVLLERDSLLVLGAPFNDVFLMKLNASRASDYDDLVALWPHCAFASFEDAARQYQAAYPHEDPDPYLADHIAGIATEAIERQCSR